MRTDEARAGEALAATSTDPTLPALAIIGGDRSVVRDDGVWATPRGARASLEAAAAHDGRDHGGGRGIEKRVSTMRALAEALARSFPLEAEAAGLSAAPTGRARRALRSLPTGDELLKLAHQMACCRPFTIEADQVRGPTSQRERSHTRMRAFTPRQASDTRAHARARARTGGARVDVSARRHWTGHQRGKRHRQRELDRWSRAGALVRLPALVYCPRRARSQRRARRGRQHRQRRSSRLLVRSIAWTARLRAGMRDGVR